jgi:hypothetical protein
MNSNTSETNISFKTSKGNKVRPTEITIMCVIGFVGALIAIPLALSDFATQIAPWYPPFLGFACFIGLVVFLGLWNMKKWAPVLYLTMCIINQIVLVSNDLWSLGGIVIPGAFVIIMFMNYDKMT